MLSPYVVLSAAKDLGNEQQRCCQREVLRFAQDDSKEQTCCRNAYGRTAGASIVMPFARSIK